MAGLRESTFSQNFHFWDNYSVPHMNYFNNIPFWTLSDTCALYGSTISQDLKWDNHIDAIVKKKASPAEKVQPATGAAETVLLCHHWISPLHVNNCLVQLSYQICPQKTTEGCPDCWANHWYNPPHSPRTVLIQREQKGWKNHSGPFTSSTLPLWTVTVWSTLQSSEHQNDQTQEQFLPSGNPAHEHLTIIMVHRHYLNTYTLIYRTHILSLHFNCT